MDKKIKWILQGNGGAFNLSTEGIKLPTLEDYEKYIEKILFERDKNLIDDSSVEMGDGFLLYSENLAYKIITFLWRNKPVIVDSNNFREVFSKLKEAEKFANRREPKTDKQYINTLKESIEELRI